jgi:hypothetical protein
MLRTTGVVLGLVTLLGPQAGAQSNASSKRSAGLLADAIAFFETNRVGMGLTNRGDFASTTGDVGARGYWPRGSANQYLFASGLQFAGVIRGTKPGNAWGGDTTGAMLYDATGPRKHGAGVTPIYYGGNPLDLANWPDLALVPSGDAAAAYYDPALQGRKSASEGDAYWITWDGDPAFISSRPHPLGLLVEHRVLAWNYPSGNEDILYVVATYYNITSLRAADYAQHRPAMRALLTQKAQDFHSLNNSKFGITLPEAGYAIDELHAGWGADPDIGNAGSNYSSVNLPFAVGFSWQRDFGRLPSWRYPPEIFGSPFFPGAGLLGTAFLGTATGPGEILVYSNNCGASVGCPSDPNNVSRLWRYLSARFDATLGDPNCGIPGDPRVTHICFIRSAAAADVRYYQSTPAHSLLPGASATVVIALVHAAPVAVPGFAPTSATDVKPFTSTPFLTASVDSMMKYGGVNLIDSIAGFRGFTDNGDGVPQPREFDLVPRSLLGKTRLARQIFDAKFLLPSAPATPEFFLIPADGKVTVLWKPSPTETTGDPYFTVAAQPTRVVAGQSEPNAMYDPNFRRFDVEGYRIYRGRTDDPASMTLLGQWDYSGTRFTDFGGNVITTGYSCAPELGLGAPPNCPATFTPITTGVASTTSFSYDIAWDLVQVNYGDRELGITGVVSFAPGRVDTAVTSQGFPTLRNSNVPFVYVDEDVRNGLRYYYAVTAFDVNSLRSGPSSMESPKVLKSATPSVPPTNIATTGSVVVRGPFGRGASPLVDDTAPLLDSVTGRFSKRAQPSNGLHLVLLGSFAAEVLRDGETIVRLDSITVGDFALDDGVPATHWFSVTSATGTTTISMPYLMAPQSVNTQLLTSQVAAIPLDPTKAGDYGGGPGFATTGQLELYIPGSYYLGMKARGCVNTSGGFSGSGTRACSYNGPRFFVGDQETVNNPNSAIPSVFNTNNTAPASYNNVGALPPGVVGLHRPGSYDYGPAIYRRVELALSPFIASSDTRIYWGSAGRIDSVVDLVHNTVVPFSPKMGVSWGILNNGAVPATESYDQRAVLTYTDVGCVAPLRNISAVQSTIPCTGPTAALAEVAVPGPIAYRFTSLTFDIARTAPSAANTGFLLYLRGQVYAIELAGGALPTAGAQWTVRDYAGAIRGGNGAGGNFGPYVFTPATRRPFTTPGASMKFEIASSTTTSPVTEDLLARVHPVPDPYYISSSASVSDPTEVSFVNVPAGARIRIYSTAATLIRVLDPAPGDAGGTITWDLRNRSGKAVASGVYFYHVESGGRSHVGRMTIAYWTAR